VASGEGRTYGVEVLLRRDSEDRLFGWLAYTLSRSVRRDGPDAPLYPSTSDQTHNLVAVAGYRFPHDLELSGRTQLLTGAPYTPQREGAFDLDIAGYTPRSGPVNSARLAPYWTVDLRVAKTWTWERFRLQAYADVLGVLHGENPQGIQYAYDATESATIAGLPTIPSLGFELKGAF
jgi:hypothetical protein